MTTLNKNARLNVNPHYTDERFRHAQTIFGRELPGLTYNYSDRLVGWDYSKHQAAWQAAKESGVEHSTCAFFERYLSEYFGKPKVIEHILAGWNWATGYPYQVFGYKDKEG